VLQEAYARAFAALDGFRGEARLGTWLARIVINEALGCIRRRRPAIDIGLVSVSPTLNAQVIPFPDANRVPDPETTMVQTEIRVLLERAVDRLPSGFREVLITRLVEGMSVAETAELLRIPPQTVKTRLFRARALLRAEMERHIGPALGDVFPFAGDRCERLADRVLRRLGLC
jgi:RNA polymerase sigma-70 factor (ECF subfamily)